MAVSAALTVVLALASAAGPERVLLCRPKVAGTAALARGDALVEAGRRSGRFLDYGVACEDGPEGARAARRVGLTHAVTATAEGRGDGSRYTLVLSDAASEGDRARRAVEVGPGRDAVAPLRAALDELLLAAPASSASRPARVLPWVTVGVGVAALAAGVVVASTARDAADRANGAHDLAAYARERGTWRSRRTTSGVLLGAGAAAVVGGLTMQFAF